MTQLTDREILVIDDSPAIGIFFRDFLKKLGFDKVHSCENGKTFMCGSMYHLRFSQCGIGPGQKPQGSSARGYPYVNVPLPDLACPQ